MKIDSPINFSLESKKIIDNYNNNKNLHDTSYWSNDDIVKLKSEIKSYYKDKQKYTCVYCNKSIRVNHSAVWDIEHIVPKSTYPRFMFIPENLCVSCKDCNTIKNNKAVLINRSIVRYPMKSSSFSIIHPHFDNYSEHLDIYLGKIYSPKTLKGKNTIEACGLLRFSYESVGWDPSISQTTGLLESAQKLLNDPENAKFYAMEMLIKAQINSL